MCLAAWHVTINQGQRTMNTQMWYLIIKYVFYNLWTSTYIRWKGFRWQKKKFGNASIQVNKK